MTTTTTCYGKYVMAYLLTIEELIEALHALRWHEALPEKLMV